MNYQRTKILVELSNETSKSAVIFKRERQKQIQKLVLEKSGMKSDILGDADFEILSNEWDKVKDAIAKGFVFESLDELFNKTYELDKKRYYAFTQEIKKAIQVFNVYLYGDKGNGKSHFCKEIAKELKREILVQNMAETPYDFVGLTDIQGNYTYSLIEQAFKYGKIIVFEEMDAYAPSALIFLNSVLEQNYITTIKGEVIERHPNTLVLATGNTDLLTPNLNYSNRNVIDIATADRFLRYHFDNYEFLNYKVSGVHYERISKIIDINRGERSVRNFKRLTIAIENNLNIDLVAKSILEVK